MNGSTLMQASNQWARRPADERFTSLVDMESHFLTIRENSRAAVVSTRQIQAEPASENPRGGLVITGPNGHAYAPTHYSFGQLANLAGAPGSYMRTLPAPLAADCLNYGLKIARDIEDVGVLLTVPYADNDAHMLRAATGPRYGRIWNAEIAGALVGRFGDGVSGDWKVPGEFGRDVTVTKENTTLFAGDRDMFVFLADEHNRIEIPNRRNGEPGSLARGFFVWNSEVGASSFGIGTFLFDYVCCNRIVWGAQEYKEIRIRHTAGAPDRFLEQIQPALQAYADGSAGTITKAIEDARAARLDNVDEFLAKRFSRAMVKDLIETHKAEEGRPIESLWDVTTAVTAIARTVPFQNERVDLERQAGDIMAMAA